MNDKTDFSAIVDMLDRTAGLIPSSAPPDCAGDDRLHYLQFVADLNDLVRRARVLKVHLSRHGAPGTPYPAPTILG
jgi:hypothetical protein